MAHQLNLSHMSERIISPAVGSYTQVLKIRYVSWFSHICDLFLRSPLVMLENKKIASSKAQWFPVPFGQGLDRQLASLPFCCWKYELEISQSETKVIFGDMYFL